MENRPLPPNPQLIPADAQRVFKGELFDVYQWQQTMFDGSHATFEMLKRPDTVSIFAIDDNKVIALDEKQPDGLIRINSIPGGRVDDEDASVLEAAKREMLEETGLEFSDWYLLQISQPTAKIEWFRYVYVAQNVIATHPIKTDPGEQIEVKKLDYQTLKKAAHRSFTTVKAFNDCQTLDEFLSGIK